MIKLTRQVENLEEVLNRIETKMEELEDKKQAIIDNACDHDREITAAEERRIEKLDEQIEELEEESDNVQNAIDYLSDYTD